MARLSRAAPDVEFHAWSGHRLEVVDVRCTAKAWADVRKHADGFLRPLQALSTMDGGLLVWEPAVPAARSISRILEAHGLLWLQPMRIRDGWEHYDAIAFAPGAEQEALRGLAAEWPTQGVRRRSIGPDDLLSSLFLSLAPVLDAPTEKQAEALLAAYAAGYYRSPRAVTTADVAAGLGIGRSAFEERLRGAENRALSQIAQALAHQRHESHQ